MHIMDMSQNTVYLLFGFKLNETCIYHLFHLFHPFLWRPNVVPSDNVSRWSLRKRPKWTTTSSAFGPAMAAAPTRSLTVGGPSPGALVMPGCFFVMSGTGDLHFSTCSCMCFKMFQLFSTVLSVKHGRTPEIMAGFHSGNTSSTVLLWGITTLQLLGIPIIGLPRTLPVPVCFQYVLHEDASHLTG